MEDWLDVAEVEAVPPDSLIVVDVNDDPVVLVRFDNSVVAFEDICTHDGGDISSGCVAEGAIECPRHGARFCLKTGAVLAPPAYEPLHLFPVKIENGTVWLLDDR